MSAQASNISDSVSATDVLLFDVMELCTFSKFTFHLLSVVKYFITTT